MLNGSRILVVEDWAPLALELKARLEDSGFGVVGPAPNLTKAIELVEHEEMAAAILDIDLRGEYVFPVALNLRTRGIPFVFITGYGDLPMPVELKDAPVLDKPVDFLRLSSIIRELTGPKT